MYKKTPHKGIVLYLIPIKVAKTSEPGILDKILPKHAIFQGYTER